MGTIQLRPNGLRSSGGVTVTGTTSIVTALADEGNDGTFVTFPAGGHNFFELDFGTFDVGGNGQFRSITPFVRHNTGINSAATVRVGSTIDPDAPKTFESLNNHGGTLQNQEGVARTKQASGEIWTQAAVNGITVGVDNYAINHAFNVTELWLRVVYSKAPTATGSSRGSVGSARPNIPWSYAHEDGAPQEAYQVKVFSAAQYNAAGFDPNTATPVLDSGVVASSNKQWTPTADLANNTAFRAFIYVSDLGSQGRTNVVTASGPYVAFTVAVTPPATPSLAFVSRVANTNAMRLEFVLTGHDNLLDFESAGFENTLGAWVAGANCSVARSTAFATSGVGSMLVTKASAAHADAVTSTYFPVAPGGTYSGVAQVRTTVAGSTARVGLRFYDSAGAQVGSTDGALGTMSDTAFTQVTVSGQAPSTAATARLFVIFPSAASDNNYVDQLGILPGTTTTWSVGGMIPAGRFRLQRSLNGGTTWTTLKRAYLRVNSFDPGAAIELETFDYSDTRQTVTVYDYEAPRGVETQYRLQVFGTVSGNVLASAWATATGIDILPRSNWWLKSLTNPAHNQRIYLNSENITWESEERQHVRYALGRPNAIVLSDVVGGETAALELSMRTEEAWAAFDILRKRQEIMLLQSPYGEQKYVRFGARRASTHMLTPTGRRLQVLTIQVIETDA